MHSAIDLSNAIEVLFSYSYSIVRSFEDLFFHFYRSAFPNITDYLPCTSLLFCNLSNFRVTTYQIIEYIYHHLQFDFDSCFLVVRY